MTTPRLARTFLALATCVAWMTSSAAAGAEDAAAEGTLRLLDHRDRTIESYTVQRESCEAGALAPVYAIWQDRVYIVRLRCDDAGGTEIEVVLPLPNGTMRQPHVGNLHAFTGDTGRLVFRAGDGVDVPHPLTVEVRWATDPRGDGDFPAPPVKD